MATETTPASSDSELAAKLLRAAGALALSIRAEGLEVLQAGRQIKANAADFATDADLAAEKFIYEQLRLARPEDSILGEEGAGFEGSSGRVWVVDPVDGTFNFTSGSTYWCSALALVTGASSAALRSTADAFAHAEVLLGAIYQPEEDKLWLGGSEHPATRNGHPIRVDPRQQLGELAAGSYIHPGWLADPRAAVPWQQAAVLPATLRMLGSGSCDLARVGQGELGLWFQHSCPSWDWLPGKGVVEAAGGETAVVPVNGLDWFVAGPAGAVAQLKAALEQGVLPE
ncbi:inositol monophosphatase family protein [Arthrobacter sp. H35-D1]|uniref:inositol monophosphatase family protein n=1 Tax=Arthrobacter sp. H35-D1 TaxID=3046202 RepID=UPI0024BB2653|nr:inositol monophosphatase family protein [Arthrobacter sp. H35-D1]MDJ0314493.1 inositol monophosphatase family protein [Arthrobacter sp. H35-D1]